MCRIVGRPRLGSPQSKRGDSTEPPLPFNSRSRDVCSGAASSRLGCAKDAGGTPLLGLVFALFAVGGDDGALAGGQIAARQNGLDLVGVERLAFEQRGRQGVQLFAIVAQNLACFVVLLVDD